MRKCSALANRLLGDCGGRFYRGPLSVSRKVSRNAWCVSSLGRRDIDRTDPLLIECVETLGKEANGACAYLKVIEIPDGIDYEVSEYDGLESVEERHRSWS